ncbi:MAG: hypothetical protein ACP5NV_06340 [Candidatus Woesearchaeota archaeon]
MRAYTYLLVFVLLLSSVIAVDSLQTDATSNTQKTHSIDQSAIPEFGVVIAFVALIGAIALFEINRKG